MINERFHQTAARYPNSLAVVDGDERISYRDLAARKASFARYLERDFNLNRGDLVAVSLPNCWEFIAGFLATAGIGAVFLPFNTQWRVREIEWLVAKVPVSVVITSRAFREPWDRLRDRIPPHRVVIVDEPHVQRELRAEPAERQLSPPPSTLVFRDNPVLYLTTSGSTGRPRIVPRSHGNLIAGANNAAEALRVSPGWPFLGVVPFYHANGFSNCMFLPLMNAATTVLINGFTPGKLTEAVRRENIRVLIASPFVYSILLDHEPGRHAFSSVKICLSSGAPMSAGLAAECAERLGLRVRQLYGSSETGTVSIELDDGEQGGETVGRPLSSVQVRVIDGDGRQRPTGEVGEIVVRSPAVMSGYAGEAERNARVFLNGFFRTGDLGKIDDKGRLTVTGRANRMINVAGIKVDPAEIERVLESMPAVRQCRAVGFKNRREMELIKVMVVVRRGGQLSRAQLVEHCRNHLAEYKIPRVVEFVEAIPASLTGKNPMPWTVRKLDVPSS